MKFGQQAGFGKAMMLFADTAEEAGMFQWLATRFANEPVTLKFETTSDEKCKYIPTLWITPNVGEWKIERK